MKKLLLFFVLITSQLYFSQSDCISAIPVCGNSSISYNSDTAGTVLEQTSGSCLGNENHSVWYVFTAATSGTVEFVINPDTVPGVLHYDYDFAVYGPNINCATQDFVMPFDVITRVLAEQQDLAQPSSLILISGNFH